MKGSKQNPPTQCNSTNGLLDISLLFTLNTNKYLGNLEHCRLERLTNKKDGLYTSHHFKPWLETRKCNEDYTHLEFVVCFSELKFTILSLHSHMLRDYTHLEFVLCFSELKFTILSLHLHMLRDSYYSFL